ncbi:hypothetical protein FXV83_23215 [Bradyrhizobium hipponense]|uniref:Uncharacterized protein n=1 Tax=Bradyrhizobium hipponense TaxID=2605638 RepID=A0A5S4YVB4_9BRAD|nr:hypothetical protein [Bradyrhizobium hipponense]TYO64279.1 hypothetical protein FXV83_23215 [Bradyrhizobium hipponense]
MKIDLKRLRGDVKRLKADRVASPIGKIKTGATEIIRSNFEELERLRREDGATWTEIASALAAQGVTQGEGQPLTGRRLTALMHNIRTRAEKLKGKAIVRDRTKMLPERLQMDGRTAKRTVSLSPEMSRPLGGSVPDQTISEDEIRRTALAKHAHLLRKR